LKSERILFTYKKPNTMAFTLPDLPYAFNALEPYIDARTMEIHHGKHHAAYTTNLNKALEGTADADRTIEDILANISKFGAGVRNNGGGFYNHNLFWTVMAPNAGGAPTGALAEAINQAFGSFDKFKEEFSAAAATRFGSGWAWLVVVDGKLKVTSTPNQDNPLMDIAEVKGTPVLGLDVWEHAYYLNYQNRRPDYVGAFWNVVNWKQVAAYYEATL
jgi:Fe-Mn family superoxide dismutase